MVLAWNLTFLAFLLIYSSFDTAQSDETCDISNRPSQVLFSKLIISDHILDGPILSTERVTSDQECQMKCIQSLQCDKYNLGPVDTSLLRHCQILKYEGGNYQARRKDGWSFRTLKGKEFNITTDENNQNTATIDEADYSFEFPIQSDTTAVVVEGMRSLVQFTMCLWIKTQDMGDGTALSYGVVGAKDEVIIQVNPEFKMRIRGSDTGFISISTNDDRWHHVCTTWESIAGAWKLYKDGVFKNEGSGVNEGKDVREGGVMVLGQEQEELGTKFKGGFSFVGQMTNVNIWDHILPEQNITEMFNSCLSGEGNVYKWADFRGNETGGVNVLEPSSCAP